MAIITAHARESSSEDTGFSFVHGRITRTAKDVFLGKGATPATREKFVKQLSDAEAEPFLVLYYVEGTKWLLPPPTVPN
ncbi:hypothetical protein J1N35_027097 [Gossypium stocksii]|uniref:Uncharacterized protein n=1 Tax=Gossypium stocksii TaxID=47602 RepID=A0A9D3V9N6_9ROSI|nr:hypothetical protein J1N35_027097 [Gossypium stocksii]